MLDDLKKISSTKKDLANFGQVIAGVCAVVAVVLALKGNHASLILAGVGLTVLIIRFAYPLILLPFQKVWMGISIILGFIVSHIILFLLFYIGVTGIGMLGRLFGKQFLDREFRSRRTSYWIKRDRKQFDKSSYEKQF
jgi:hypothetical protein